MKAPIPITDPADRRLDAYFRMTNAQMRSKIEPEKGIFIAEAQTVIETALDEGLFPLSALIDESLLNTRAEVVIGRCEKINPSFETYSAPPELLRQTTGFELTRGMLCVMRRPAPRDARTLIAGARTVAVLEGICDSTNIGAILRSAAGIGIDAVLLTGSCADPLLRRAVRVSMGTVFKVPWAVVDDAQTAVRLLKDAGFLTVALALRSDAQRIDELFPAPQDRVALFFGTEGDGLKPGTIEACDRTAIIPMQNGVDSLNVAAAAAVAFWEIRARESYTSGVDAGNKTAPDLKSDPELKKRLDNRMKM